MKTFREFLLESTIKQLPKKLTLYHGSNTFFNKVDFSKLGRTDSGFLGRGFYLTGVKQLANAYAHSSTSNHGGEPTVLNVMVEPKKYLHLTGTGPHELKDSLNAVGIDTTSSTSISKRLLSLGYDSVVAWDSDGSGKIREFVVIDPKIIKNITRGTYEKL